MRSCSVQTVPTTPYGKNDQETQNAWLPSRTYRRSGLTNAIFDPVICQVKARVSRARSGERANQEFQDVLRATVCLSASVPALGRTRHPFAVSGLEGPSQNVWSAALSQAKNDDRGIVRANVFGLFCSHEH